MFVHRAAKPLGSNVICLLSVVSLMSACTSQSSADTKAQAPLKVAPAAKDVKAMPTSQPALWQAKTQAVNCQTASFALG
jgi:hypothetical protein